MKENRRAFIKFFFMCKLYCEGSIIDGTEIIGKLTIFYAYTTGILWNAVMT
jgi:hypothetical protein